MESKFFRQSFQLELAAFEQERNHGILARCREGIIQGESTGVWDLSRPDAIHSRIIELWQSPDYGNREAQEAHSIAAHVPLLRVLGDQGLDLRSLDQVQDCIVADAWLKLACAVRDFDVITLGFEVFEDGVASRAERRPTRVQDILEQGSIRCGLPGLPDLEKALVMDYARQALFLFDDIALRPIAIKMIFHQVTIVLRALAAMNAATTEVLGHPDALDPIPEMRRMARELAIKGGYDPGAVARWCDAPEETFLLQAVPEFLHLSPYRLRFFVAEQLCADLSRELGLLDSETTWQWEGMDGRPITFPDGLPRVSTPFDKVLSHYNSALSRVFDAQWRLIQSSLDLVVMLTSVGFLRMDFTGLRSIFGDEIYSRGMIETITLLARDHAHAAYLGRAIPEDREVMINRLRGVQGESAALYDELRRLYACHPPAVAAAAGWSLDGVLRDVEWRMNGACPAVVAPVLGRVMKHGMWS